MQRPVSRFVDHLITHTQTTVGNFIFQNYRQALEKIASSIPQLAALESKLKTTDADYEGYLNAKRAHLQALKTEPEGVQRAIDYMEILSKVEKCLSVIITHVLCYYNL